MITLRKPSAHHMSFAAFLGASLILFWAPLRALVGFALEYQHYSHIPLIPLVCIFLVFSERQQIFRTRAWSHGVGATMIVAGLGLFYLGKNLASSLSQNDQLSASILGMVIAWLGGFILCYGTAAFRAGMFPLLFLVLMVPIPDLVLEKVIAFLLRGSSEVSALLFDLTGVPVLRKGPVFVLPGLTIEVARECSGIRSSMALFVTSLLAGHLFLRSSWRKLCLVGATLPILILKNAARIVTLTLLSIYVDPGFLSGRLHNSGGVLFFALGLVLMLPILLFLERSEKRSQRAGKVSFAS